LWPPSIFSKRQRMLPKTTSGGQTATSSHSSVKNSNQPRKHWVHAPPFYSGRLNCAAVPKSCSYQRDTSPLDFSLPPCPPLHARPPLLLDGVADHSHPILRLSLPRWHDSGQEPTGLLTFVPRILVEVHAEGFPRVRRCLWVMSWGYPETRRLCSWRAFVR